MVQSWPNSRLWVSVVALCFCHTKPIFSQKEEVTDGHLPVSHLLSSPQQALVVLLSLSFPSDNLAQVITVNVVQAMVAEAYRGCTLQI